MTASEVLPTGLDIGVRDGKIICIGSGLPSSASTQVIDAEGAYITPGGVDSHVHLAQENAPTGDGWETGTRSAIAGGTTTIIAFASQQKSDTSLFPVLEEYNKTSKDQSYCDYSYHFILTNPTKEILRDELPVMAHEHGITSVKLYMTYEIMKLNDREVLDILFACKALGMTTMIHAESHDMISLIIEGLERNKHTEPYYHAIARPRIAEDEASYRAISLAEFADAPMLIVHMSSEVALAHVRDAQTRLLPIHAETCPQYLFLLSERLKADEHDHFAGAKHVCSPPLRHDPKDLEGLWRNVAKHRDDVLFRPRGDQVFRRGRQASGFDRRHPSLLQDPERFAWGGNSHPASLQPDPGLCAAGEGAAELTAIRTVDVDESCEAVRSRRTQRQYSSWV